MPAVTIVYSPALDVMCSLFRAGSIEKAWQKAVLLALNESEALQDTIEFDSQLPGGYYKRAWELVNAGDTEYMKNADEIRQ